MLSSSGYNSATALVQIDQIIALKNDWSFEWVRDHTESSIFRGFKDWPFEENYKWIFGQDKPSQSKSSRDKPSSSWANFGFTAEADKTFPAELLWIKGKKGTSFVNQTRPRIALTCHFPEPNWWSHDGSPNSFPKTLKEFRDWWNGLSTPRTVVAPSALPFVTTSSDFTFNVLFSEIKAKDVPHLEVPLYFFIDPSQKRYAYTARFEDHSPGSRSHDVTVIIPIESSYAYSVNQQTISTVFTNVQPGTFERSFSDLLKAARNEMNLPLQDIKDLVHEEAAKSADMFEVFGMKFPANQITTWGTVLVLAVQLYFLIYLRQLRGKLRADDLGWDVPWIGMDESAIGRVALFCTVVLLPCLAVGLLGWQGSLAVSRSYWESTEHFVRFTIQLWKWDRWVLAKVFTMMLALVAAIYLSVQSWANRPKPNLSSRVQLFE